MRVWVDAAVRLWVDELMSWCGYEVVNLWVYKLIGWWADWLMSLWGRALVSWLVCGLSSLWVCEFASWLVDELNGWWVELLMSWIVDGFLRLQFDEFIPLPVAGFSRVHKPTSWFALHFIHERGIYLVLEHKGNKPLPIYRNIKCLAGFYVKPQHINLFSTTRCVILFLYIKPQLEWLREFSRPSCVIAFLYIKPQPIKFA